MVTTTNFIVSNFIFDSSSRWDFGCNKGFCGEFLHLHIFMSILVMQALNT